MPTTIPDIGSNSISGMTNKKREEKTDYTVMSTAASASSPKKEKGKGWLLNLILPEDVPDIMTYLKMRKDDIIKYVIWPKIRDGLIESFTAILGASFNGKQSSQRTISRVSYESKYQQVGSTRSSEPMKMANPKYSIYENLGFDSADEADEFMGLVEDLFDDQNGYITVLQFYNIARRQTSPEQSNYGWLSLSGMKRIYSAGRYYVDMPWPVPLN